MTAMRREACPEWCTSTHEYDEPGWPPTPHSMVVCERGNEKVRLLKFLHGYRVDIQGARERAAVFIDAEDARDTARVLSGFGTDRWLVAALRMAYRAYERAVIEDGLPEAVESPLINLVPRWVRSLAKRKGLLAAEGGDSA